MKQSPDVRTRLLAAARQLFARHGYEGASVRAITSRAKANLGAVTYHFGSKQALYHAVLASLMEPMGDKLARAAEGGATPLAKVETMVRAFFAHLRDHPDVPALMVQEMAAGRPVPPPVQRAMGRALGLLSGVIGAGQTDGSIRAGDPMLLSLSVLAQPMYLNVARRALAVVASVHQDEPGVFDRVVEHAVTAVRALLANHGEARP